MRREVILRFTMMDPLSKMTSLFLLCCIILNHIQLTPSISLDLSLPSSNNPNILRLQCINNNGSPDSNARFKIGMVHSLGTDDGSNYLTYNITRNTEAVVLCMIGNESSTPTVFAAIPTVSNDTVFFDVPRGREHTILTCPIPLPTAHMSLNYTITWERIITNSIPIPLTDDPESYGYRLLQNNRSLSLPVSSSTDQKVYRCKLALTRCNITAIDRCVVAPIIGPNIRFKILGYTSNQEATISTLVSGLVALLIVIIIGILMIALVVLRLSKKKKETRVVGFNEQRSRTYRTDGTEVIQMEPEEEEKVEKRTMISSYQCIKTY